MNRDTRSIGTVLAASGAALVAFTIYGIRGIGYLHERHPHEDAYILFRYVEHLVAGHGVAFNPGGPPTEGATDFLWMILLSGWVWLGTDVARAAVWLNALGCALMAHVIARLWLSAVRPGVLSYVAPLIFAACLPRLSSAHAAYDGFSVQLYCGLVLALCWLWLQGTARSLAMVPYVALAVALFRPDGVLLGGGFYLVSVLVCLRDRHALRSLLLHGAVVAVLGGLYFVWRAWYFGELLPLPLYVKSRGSSGPVGLDANLRWLQGGHGPIPLLVCAGAFGAVLVAAMRLQPLRSLLALVPAGLLFAALSFAHQTQNVDWRFQAPIYVLVMVVTLRLGVGVVELVELGPRWQPRTEAGATLPAAIGVLRTLLTLAVVLACLLALRPALDRGKQLFPRDYMDTFAVHAGPTLDDAVIVLTEAGRVPYWTSGTVFDMVGLNLAETARKPPSLQYIDGLDPDVIMFHVAGTIDFSRLMVHGPGRRPVTQVDPQRTRMVRIAPRSLPEALHEDFRAMRKDLPVTYESGDDAQVKTASIILEAYLAEHAGDFEAYVLPYGDAHNHVFGVRVGRAAVADFQALLARAVELPYESYAQARRWPRSIACGIADRVAALWGKRSSACGW